MGAELHASDDAAVPPGNSLAFYQALGKAGVAAELHIFRSGGHGFGIRHAVDPVTDWPRLLSLWLDAGTAR